MDEAEDLVEIARQRVVKIVSKEIEMSAIAFLYESTKPWELPHELEYHQGEDDEIRERREALVQSHVDSRMSDVLAHLISQVASKLKTTKLTAEQTRRLMSNISYMVNSYDVNMAVQRALISN